MPSKKRILIASDHAGLLLKSALKKSLTQWIWNDLGPFNSENVDYPDFAELLGQQIASGDAEQGILICGSGIGMSIVANKVPGVRAAVVENPVSARLSREHNDLNVLCLGSRLLGPEYAIEIAKVWLSTPFSADPRHIKRIEKIHSMDHFLKNRKPVS